MNPTTARFLLDECLGRPIVEPLLKLVGMGRGEKPDIAHVLDFTVMGTPDEIWIPRIAREGWTVITIDGGRTPNKQRGEKLPRLCARLGITHVILSPSVHERTAFEKLLTILSVWYGLIDIADNPAERGNRYLLEPSPSKQRGSGRLTKRLIPVELLVLREEYFQSNEQPPTKAEPPSQ